MKPVPFPTLTTQEDVAKFLGLTWPHLRHLLYRTAEPSRYREFTIRKRRGGTRVLEAPTDQLKGVQRTLLTLIQNQYHPRAAVHGFTFGRNILTNARVHVRAKWVLNVDLKDFFPTIHIGRIIGLFSNRPFGCGTDAATMLAQICTYKRRLPQGAPTSPLLSNMICFRLDRVLLQLARSVGCRYTRYADDITFSSRLSGIPAALATLSTEGKVTVGAELTEAINQEQFQINEEKVALLRRPARMTVTGLKVNRFPNVRKRLVSQIRAMIHDWKTRGIEAAQHAFETKWDHRSRAPGSPAPAFRNVLLGKLLFLGYIRGYHDARFTRFALDLYALDPNLLPKAPAYAASQMAHGSTCVLTDDGEEETGTGFFLKGVGLVTCYHVAKFATRAFYPDAANDFREVKMASFDKNLDLAVCRTELRPRNELMPNFVDLPNGTGVFLHGFPAYSPGFPGVFQEGKIVSKRNVGHTRYIVSMRIMAGNSGGPLLDGRGRAVGIAVTGDAPQTAGYQPSDYAVIPIRLMKELVTAV